MEICFHIKLFPPNAFIHPLPNIIFRKMKYSHKKTCRKPCVLLKGNYTAMVFSQLTPKVSFGSQRRRLKICPAPFPIRGKRNSHQYSRVLKNSIQTFHCVNETRQKKITRLDRVSYKYCLVKQFIAFVFRFLPSAKLSNWIKNNWITKLKDYTTLKGSF